MKKIAADIQKFKGLYEKELKVANVSSVILLKGNELSKSSNKEIVKMSRNHSILSNSKTYDKINRNFLYAKQRSSFKSLKHSTFGKQFTLVA